MKRLASLVNELTQLRGNIHNLKFELQTRENKAYADYKKENPNDRSAYDKVIALLKSEYKEWLDKEKQLQDLEIRYKNLSSIFSLVNNMISNPTVSLRDVDDLLKQVVK